MNRIDIPVMANQLNMLAEVYEKRQISEKGALVWFDTLKEFPLERIAGLLIGWPKSHSKFPVPSEVWRELNERSIADREVKHEEDKKRFERETERMGATDQGKAIIARLRKLMQEPADRLAWAKEIVRAHEEGDCLRYTSFNSGERLSTAKPPRHPPLDDYKAACAALRRSGFKDRVPGEDDEVIAA